MIFWPDLLKNVRSLAMTWFVKSTHVELGRSIINLGVFCMRVNDLNPSIEKSMYFLVLRRAFAIFSTSLAAAFNAAPICTDQPLNYSFFLLLSILCDGRNKIFDLYQNMTELKKISDPL